MGEYATRKSDGEEIKIGTCENMYYIRWEDKSKVTPNKNNSFGLRWRLPFPDEDHLQPGDYKEYNRSYRLYDHSGNDFDGGSEEREAGNIQLSHECGLLLNVPCHHGKELPDVGEKVKVFWNGKSWFFELASIREDNGKLYPVVCCKHCREQWRYSWDEILPFVQDQELNARLQIYAAQ